MVRDPAAGPRLRFEQKRNALCAALLGPLRTNQNRALVMAAPTRIFSLNLGSQTIGLAEFRVQAHGGLVLLDYRFREIATELVGGEIRHAAITIALREMMNELQIKHGRVNYAVAGQSVFERFVKLPAVEEEKIERIISFEAQQNVPFPINEVVWDYQLVGGGGDEQIQVVLVAIKVDLLDGINSVVEEAGLRTSIVDIAPMALYNAFRYSYSDLSGCSLLVDRSLRRLPRNLASHLPRRNSARNATDL